MPDSSAPEGNEKPARQLEFDFEQSSKDAERAEDERVFAQMERESGLPPGALDFSRKLHRHFHPPLMAPGERRGRAEQRKQWGHKETSESDTQAPVPAQEVSSVRSDTSTGTKAVLASAAPSFGTYILPVDAPESEINGSLLAPLKRKMTQMFDRYKAVKETLDPKHLSWRLAAADLEELRAEMLAAHVRVPDALKFAQWDDKVSLDGWSEKMALQAFLDLCDAYTTNEVRKRKSS